MKHTLRVGLVLALGVCLFSPVYASGLRNPKTLQVRDEGVSQGDAKAMDFTGSSVSASVASGVATITVTGASASGSNGNVQYNDGGSSLGGDPSFSWNKTSNMLGISRDAGQVGLAFVISSDTGVTLASMSHDGGATLNSLTLANRLSVDSGGTGLTSGTSGGILGFTASGTISSSNLLTASAVIVGGGSGSLPTAITADTATVGHFLGSTAGSPAFRQVVTSDVNGVLGSNNGGTGLTTFTKGDLLVPNASGNIVKLAVGGTDGYVLSVDSTTTTGLKWGPVGGGGSGTPGGTANQFQYNSAGAFGGTSVMTWDATNLRASIGVGTGPVSFDVAGSVRNVRTQLTDAATINLDASRSSNFLVILGGNRTLGNPTNLVPGQAITLLVSQDATGSRKLGFGTGYKFGSDCPSYDSSTIAGTKDYIFMRANSNVSMDVCGVSKGFR
jgi:hypothetical protein